jgi:uncharacterized protein with von Willebrand factor type A (vWA) domain
MDSPPPDASAEAPPSRREIVEHKQPKNEKHQDKTLSTENKALKKETGALGRTEKSIKRQDKTLATEKQSLRKETGALGRTAKSLERTDRGLEKKGKALASNNNKVSTAAKANLKTPVAGNARVNILGPARSNGKAVKVKARDYADFEDMFERSLEDLEFEAREFEDFDLDARDFVDELYLD